MPRLLLAPLALLAAFFAILPGLARADARSEALAMYAGSAKPEGDALLRRMLASPKDWSAALSAMSAEDGLPPRLYIDAARALVYAGDDARELALAASSLARAPFALIDRSEWLYLCQKIAQRGGDAMPCARRLLDEPLFHIGLLGGDDGVGKDYALTFLLLEMPEQSWNREVGDRLWRGGDSPNSQTAMLCALFYAVSLRDDAILAKFAQDPTRPQAARERADSLLTQMSAMERNASPDRVATLRQAMGIPAAATEEDLRLARRKALAQVSRAGLVDLERYTFLIRADSLERWKERLRKLD